MPAARIVSIKLSPTTAGMAWTSPSRVRTDTVNWACSPSLSGIRSSFAKPLSGQLEQMGVTRRPKHLQGAVANLPAVLEPREAVRIVTPDRLNPVLAVGPDAVACNNVSRALG